ncbi:MAG: peptidylprolyl isomerase [Mariprofundaceae bacterium]
MYKAFTLLIMMGWVSQPLYAEVIDSIAAIVNDEVLTCYMIEQDQKDLVSQLQRSSTRQLPPRQQIFERALEQRITRALQMQEAKRLEVTASDDAIKRAMSDVEKRNNIPPGELPNILKKEGINIDRYRQQLLERLTNSSLMNVAVRSKIKISEEALHEYYRKHLKNPKPVREVRLEQIFLAIDPDPAPIVLAQTNTKAEQLRASALFGEPFSQLARLNSDAANAVTGGDMGWLQAGALPPSFSHVLELPLQDISQPLRTPTGIHLLRVAEERWIQPEPLGESYHELHARHILIKLPSSADETIKKKIRRRTVALAKALRGASDEEFSLRAQERSQGPSAGKGGDLGWFRLGQMVPEFDAAVLPLQKGEVSPVVETQFGLHIIRMVDRRYIDPNSFESHRNKIEGRLINAEMQIQAPRWIRSLKARAMIQRKACQTHGIAG